MAKRIIIWTKNSEIQLQNILEYYKTRNQSPIYSRKLYKKIKRELKGVSINPEIGTKTKLKNIRGLIIDDYIVFYEILENQILILKVWDCRQNPESLNIPR